ncbi:response regulator [Rhodovibrio salinarum]|uniref:Response regulator n=1 Tax=Rhodovibrio salinarum TaxID=1087 RepID=A0A934QJU3_9PROT|nr:response regulator [Rhodovibrio salinarum]MBK1698438.1 response regulator [Rhodovibrio salinarum]
MSAPTPSLAGRHILIAEDEYLIARDLELTLIDAGCAKVFLVPSIAECQHIRAQERLDAFVLDLRLRDGDASDFAREVLAAGIPVVFITGYEEAVIPEDLGHLPLLAKPFPRLQLVSTLVTALPPATETHN